MTYTSTCHCGALQAVVDEDLPTSGLTCNCSICRRKGNIHHFTAAGNVRLDMPADRTGSYTFNKGAIEHHFCTACGCSPFARGKGPDGSEMVEINLRCVAQLDLETLQINTIDGASM